MNEVPVNKNRSDPTVPTRRWNKYFDDASKYKQPSDSTARSRQRYTGIPFETRYMLRLYTNDYFVLLDRGWPIPYWHYYVNWTYVWYLQNNWEYKYYYR